MKTEPPTCAFQHRCCVATAAARQPFQEAALGPAMAKSPAPPTLAIGSARFGSAWRFRCWPTSQSVDSTNPPSLSCRMYRSHTGQTSTCCLVEGTSSEATRRCCLSRERLERSSGARCVLCWRLRSTMHPSCDGCLPRSCVGYHRWPFLLLVVAYVVPQRSLATGRRRYSKTQLLQTNGAVA